MSEVHILVKFSRYEGGSVILGVYQDQEKAIDACNVLNRYNSDELFTYDVITKTVL